MHSNIFGDISLNICTAGLMFSAILFQIGIYRPLAKVSKSPMINIHSFDVILNKDPEP